MKQSLKDSTFAGCSIRSRSINSGGDTCEATHEGGPEQNSRLLEQERKDGGSMAVRNGGWEDEDIAGNWRAYGC